jgi:hypothetical protein
MTHGHRRARYRAIGMPVRSRQEGHAEFLPAFDASHRHPHREGLTVRFGLECVSLVCIVSYNATVTDRGGGDEKEMNIIYRKNSRLRT